jgi:hypothetical protein
MNTTIPQATTATTYESQLAERVGELLPDLNTDERLELLAVMGPDEMSTTLAWIAATYPQVLDFALVRDRGLAGKSLAALVSRSSCLPMSHPSGQQNREFPVSRPVWS